MVEYARLLSGYKEANIVGTGDETLVLREHVLDSLSCLLCEPVSYARSLVDVGTGGGLPGIPLKLARPKVELTLVESTRKKSVFLRQVADHLSLADVEVANTRAEEFGHERRHRDKYDIATARAVAPLPIIAEYCLPLVRPGGHLIAMKALPTEWELEAGKSAARTLSAALVGEIRVQFLPELPVKQRRLLILQKTEPTPPGYPRRVGLPKKRPLGTK